MGKGGTTPKEWKTEENRCGYHSKLCTQVVSTACLFEILVSHYLYTVLLEKGVSNKRIPKATEVATNPIQDSRVNLLEEGGNDTI